MTTALTLMQPAQPSRPQSERITQLEMPPQVDWLVPATTPSGRRVWYCRFAVTGLFPRLYGPFASKRKAVRFLDAAISTLSESLAEIDARPRCAQLRRRVSEIALRAFDRASTLRANQPGASTRRQEKEVHG